MTRILISLSLFILLSATARSQNLIEKGKLDGMADSVFIYHVVTDSPLTNVKYIRLQLFEKRKFINGQDLITYDYSDSKMEFDTTKYMTIEEDGAVRIEHDEMTGRIVQGDSRWMHPPRGDFFKVLELTAFPFFIKNRKKWNYNVSFGDHWADERWLIWTGRKMNQSTYKRRKIRIPYIFRGQKLYCKKIVAKSELEDLGHTESIFYCHKEYGFVYMQCRLINNKLLKLVMV